MSEKYLATAHPPTTLDLSTGSKFNLLLQILGVVLFGALTVIGKKATMDLGISGHSALLWLSIMIAGRALIQREGVGFALGVSTALWGIPGGLNHSLLHNIGLYGSTGIVLDLAARSSFLDIRRPLGAIIAGAMAHMVKFLFIIGKASLSVTAKRFVLFGLLQSGTLHLIFGLGAGLIGYGIYSLLRPRQQIPDKSQ